MQPHAIADQLRALGLPSGAVAVVHVSFRAVSPVDGGPTGFISALRRALGPDGTLVMPSMSDDDDHPFDRTSTPCRAMGSAMRPFPIPYSRTGPRARRARST